MSVVRSISTAAGNRLLIVETLFEDEKLLRIMDTICTSKSESIQSVYENYIQKKYIVNRRYQRKLVWSLEEKEAFIDSVYRRYSVPLFLFAQPKTDVMQYEIIDGMQRLNAIFCFIENEFGLTIDGQRYYFDLETLGRTNKMREDGILKQKTPKLDRESCIAIMNYELPLTTVIADTKNIEEIFRRINSYGRQLSNQEIRQAGALGLFPDLVRRVSAKVRGDDSTRDIIGLNDMKLISLSNGKLHYGIEISKVFWVKEKIITLENMRKSRDEELVAQLLAYMIIGTGMNPSKRSLDGLYHYEDDEEGLSSRVESGINRIGVDVIVSWFEIVYSEILMTIHKAGTNFSSLMYGDKQPESVTRLFQVVFLSFFELLVNKKKKILDYKKLIEILKGCGARSFSGLKSRDSWNARFRAEKVKVLMALIDSAFVDRQGSDVIMENWTSQIDNLLHKSSIEGGQYDFKIGFHDLKTGQFNEELVKKCVEILTAEANAGPRTKGYILVGVADNKNAADFWKNRFCSSYQSVEGLDFHVVGLNKEIATYYKNGDEFIRKIKQVIKSCLVSEDVKKYILMNMKLVQYYGRDILVLELQSDKEPLPYADDYYVREGNDTNKLTTAQAISLSKRFASI